MATLNEQKLARAREIIKAQPSIGKDKVNRYLRMEFGSGLRSRTILGVKGEVAQETPRLIHELYRYGGVSPSKQNIYKQWRVAGFLPSEARELTIGHGGVLVDSQRVFESMPGAAARRTRIAWIQMLADRGWNAKQIMREMRMYYALGQKRSPWDFIRAEYRGGRKIKDILDYQDKARKRAEAKTSKLYRHKR